MEQGNGEPGYEHHHVGAPVKEAANGCVMRMMLIGQRELGGRTTFRCLRALM